MVGKEQPVVEVVEQPGAVERTGAVDCKVG